MENLYFDLLKDWCDAMVKLQYRNSTYPILDGGMLCPACTTVHGRCGDAIYPLTYMTAVTGDTRYIEVADRLFCWQDNVTCEDGSYCNDLNGEWKGITVFAAMTLAKTIYYHGDIIPDEMRSRWEARLWQMADYLCSESCEQLLRATNINYPISYAGTMAMFWKLSGDDKYLVRARAAAQDAKSWLSENLLIYGEGKPQRIVTPKGCRAIDIGYNVEESLPMLAIYANVTGDTETMEWVQRSMLSHLEFMLPDGGWDNSVGSRNFKWSYWGSRTSDGIQEGIAAMPDADPRLLLAACRNTLLLRELTKDGLLYGGLHYMSHGEQPCVHHTFCHAKALAAALDGGLDKIEIPEGVVLPREEEYGLKYYPELDTALVSVGQWRATVTGYDFAYHGHLPVSGGSISVLWHKDIGCLIAGSTTEHRMHEPSNLQMPRKFTHIPTTPMIEYSWEGRVYRSVCDDKAVMKCTQEGNAVVVTANGVLTDKERNVLSQALYSMTYRFMADAVEIEIGGSFPDGTIYRLPVASPSGEDVMINGNNVLVQKERATVVVEANQVIVPMDTKKRIFTYAPGVEAVPITFSKPDGLKIRISVK